MSLPNELLPVGLLGTGAADTGYLIERSIRFNSADSAHLSRTFASAGNRKTWTWAGWVKRSALGATLGALFGNPSGSNDTTYARLVFNNDCLQFGPYSSWWRITTRVFRDPSAWYHIVLVFDTTQATAANRVKLYVNGVEETAFSTSTDPALNTDYAINIAAQHEIGRSGGDGLFNGYLADVHFIDGQALTPDSFGEFDTNNVWQPKKYSGGTYGTNGFQLKFADNSTAAALGTDTSGNGNTWTVNNITASDFSVSSASGALPIYNTTGLYGTTQSSGLRSDSNASFLSLATALGNGSGLDLVDQNVSGRTSSIKTVTNAGAVAASGAHQFYGGSARFTGSTNSRASVASSADFAFGTGDFTVEFWVKSEATTTNPSFFRRFFTTGPDSVNSVQLGHIVNTSGVVVYYTSTTVLTSTTNILRRWCHVALTRSSGTVRLFVNGVLEASGTDTNDKTNNTVSIGNYNNTDDGRMQGELQDLRVYKGIAKYTSSFSVPSRSLSANNDSLIDSPTNGSQVDTGLGGEVIGNYCTLNPLQSYLSTTSNGNLDCSSNGGWIGSTIHMTTGKWYVEYTIGSSSIYQMFGVMSSNYSGSGFPWQSSTPNVTYYAPDGRVYIDGVNTGTTTGATNGDIISLSFDADARTIVIRKNNNTFTTTRTITAASSYMFYVSDGGTTADSSINFGQRQFVYTAPSGFKALCTQNLPAPTITNGATAMDVKLYTGNGSTQTISGLGFSPDLVWIKQRSNTEWHGLFDTVRGVLKPLFSNATDAEGSGSGVSAFASNGFDLTGNTYVNGNASTYVAWTWDAGSSTVTNTQGSITSSCRANQSSGFSIVSYTGTGANATVGHGLGVAPQLIITKCRGASSDWGVYHVSIGATAYLRLNLTNAASTGVGPWNNTAPTSTVFSIGTNGATNTANTMVAYCFAPVASYSAFGSYSGNGLADGPFVYTGFRPRWVMFKTSTEPAAGNTNWYIYDATRLGYNTANRTLQANSSGAEGAAGDFDLLSNGFKLRTNNGGLNTSAATYIWAAFAENPFALARAR